MKGFRVGPDAQALAVERHHQSRLDRRAETIASLRAKAVDPSTEDPGFWLELAEELEATQPSS